MTFYAFCFWVVWGLYSFGAITFYLGTISTRLLTATQVAECYQNMLLPSILWLVILFWGVFAHNAKGEPLIIDYFTNPFSPLIVVWIVVTFFMGRQVKRIR